MILSTQPPASPPPRGRDTPRHLPLLPLLLGHALAAALVVGIAVLTLQASRDSLLREARTQVSNRTGEVRQKVAAELQRVDLAMRHVALTNRRGVDALHATPHTISESLSEHAALVPEVTRLRQTDEQGVVRYRPLGEPEQPESVATHPLFLEALQTPGDGLLISDPLYDPRSEHWHVAVGRRVTDRDGRFVGVVMGELDTRQLDALIRLPTPGRNDTIALRSQRLALISRQVGADETAQPIGTHQVSPNFRDAVERSPAGGFVITRHAVDAVERVTGFVKVGEYPLYVAAGVGLDEALAPWRQQLLEVGGLALLALLALAGSGTLTLRSWRLQARSARQMAEASRLTQVLMAAAADGVHVLDRDGRLVALSDSFAEMLGWPRGALLGRHVSTWDHSAPPEALTQQIQSYAVGQRQSFETTHLRADGVPIQVEISAVALRLDEQELLYCASRDTTRRKQMEAEQAAMLDNDLVGILKMRDRRVLWANRAVRQMFGVPEGAALNDIASAIPDGVDLVKLERQALAEMLAGGRFRAQLPMRRRDGSTLWVDLSGTLLNRDAAEFLWVLADITELKRYQTEIEHVAVHDALTGLPNRRLLDDRLGQGLALSRRNGDLLAVSYLDLDGFKGVNDRLGHAAGDLLLKQVAQRLLGGVRGHDTVCRLGGDEFVLLLPALAHPEEADHVVQRVLEALHQPFELGDEQVRISASAGLALYPQDSHDGETLLRLADLALYQAKRAGRNRLQHAASAGTPPPA